MAQEHEIIYALAKKLDLKKNTSKKIAYGLYNNFTVLLYGTMSDRTEVNIVLCASCNGESVKPGFTSNIQLPKGVRCVVDKFRICLTSRVGSYKKATVDLLTNALYALTLYLNEKAFRNCDPKGVEGPTSVYFIGDNMALLSNVTASQIQASVNKNAAEEAMKPENYAAGILGAVIGAALVMGLILLIARVGRIFYISGLVMGLAMVYGYKLLGKKFSLFSVLACGVISVLMTYLTFRLNIGIDIYSSISGIRSFGYCFSNAKEICEPSVYNHNLLLFMLIGIIGTFAVIGIEYSIQKKKYYFKKSK